MIKTAFESAFIGILKLKISVFWNDDITLDDVIVLMQNFAWRNEFFLGVCQVWSFGLYWFTTYFDTSLKQFLNVRYKNTFHYINAEFYYYEFFFSSRIFFFLIWFRVFAISCFRDFAKARFPPSGNFFRLALMSGNFFPETSVYVSITKI